MSHEPLNHLIRRLEPLRVTDTIDTVARRIAEHGSGIPVADDDGLLIGFIYESDLLAWVTPKYLRDLHGTDLFRGDPTALHRAVERARATTVADHMQPDPAFIDTDDSEMNAAARFLQSGQRTLAAVDATTRKVVGILRMPELLADLMRDPDATPDRS